jgi:hypothetical protein
MTEKYQGWANYPTWVVQSWLENDEGLYWHCRTLNRKYTDTGKLAYALKDWVCDLMPALEGLAADLLGYALDEVDWYEIAESIEQEYVK